MSPIFLSRLYATIGTSGNTGLGIRLKRICSDENKYRHRKKELKQNLQKRGYPNKFVNHELSRVDNLNRKDLLKKKETNKTANKRVPLAITYSNNLPNIHSIIRKQTDNFIHQTE